MTDLSTSGLRPIARRLDNSDLNRHTRRIVMPPVEQKNSEPLTTLEPPKSAQDVKTTALTKNFSIVPCVDQALYNVFPHGIRLTSEWLYVGRNPYAAIDSFLALVINRDGVSKLHASLTEYLGKAFITDLGSSNGTTIFRNQKAIEVKSEPVQLLPNDIICFGPILFRVVTQ